MSFVLQACRGPSTVTSHHVWLGSAQSYSRWSCRVSRFRWQPLWIYFLKIIIYYLKRAEKSNQISHHPPLVQTERSGAGARRNGPISVPAASSQQMHHSDVVRMLCKLWAPWWPRFQHALDQEWLLAGRHRACCHCHPCCHYRCLNFPPQVTFLRANSSSPFSLLSHTHKQLHNR